MAAKKSQKQDSVRVFVLVDHNPLGLKCGTVATIPAGQAERLSGLGIVDLSEAAVSRGMAQLSDGADREQVIEDED